MMSMIVLMIIMMFLFDHVVYFKFKVVLVALANWRAGPKDDHHDHHLDDGLDDGHDSLDSIM